MDYYDVNQSYGDGCECQADPLPVTSGATCNNPIYLGTLNDVTAHAEMQAFTAAADYLGGKYLKKCTLYVTLEPCTMCAGAMINARVGRLIYGATDKKAGACESLYRIPTDARLNHQPEMIKGVLADECAQLLKDFFKLRRKQNKQKRLEKRSA